MMFPPRATGLELADLLARHRDLEFAVATMPPPMCRYQRNTRWQFFIEDPREETNRQILATYRCIESGDQESRWLKMKRDPEVRTRWTDEPGAAC